MAYYDDLLADIHKTFPSKDAATCRAAIAYCNEELAKKPTGEWLKAVTACLAEYTNALNAGTSSSGTSVLSGANAVLPTYAGGPVITSGGGTPPGALSVTLGNFMTTVTQNPILLIGLAVAGYLLYKKRKGVRKW